MRPTSERMFKYFLALGEGEHVEFKRCSKGVCDDTFETVCSFANGGGGDIFLGVEDGGTVRGIACGNIETILGTITRTATNPVLFSPPVELLPEVFRAGAKTLVRIRVAPGTSPCSYKGVVYRRVGDADIADK